LDAITIYQGPAHRIVSMSPEMLELTGFDAIGMPAREVFPGYGETQRLMDQVYRTGVAAHRFDVTPDGRGGWTVIVPWLDHGVVVGLVTNWRESMRPVAPLPLRPEEPIAV
jgi:hypothetical protein